MARTVSAKAQVKKLRFLVLRSLYYRQGLPKQLLHGMTESILASEISAMTELKLIKKERSGSLALTELGREYLFNLSGNRKPPMIDFDTSALLPKKKQKQFIVRSSLAAEIFRMVRHGE